MTDNGARSSREQVLDELRLADKLIVVTHENPDGDALGSLAAMQGILSELGKDSMPFVDERDLPLPSEYRFLELPGLTSVPPPDVDERPVLFLDCGNLERNPAQALPREGPHPRHPDHHHHNAHLGRA